MRQIEKERNVAATEPADDNSPREEIARLLASLVIRACRLQQPTLPPADEFPRHGKSNRPHRLR